MIGINEQEDIIKQIDFNMDGQSVIVREGLRVRGDSYRLTDGINSVDTKYIGFQEFYEKHGFIEEGEDEYKVYLVQGAGGINNKVNAHEQEMQNPLIISKELSKIKQLEDIE